MNAAERRLIALAAAARRADAQRAAAHAALQEGILKHGAGMTVRRIAELTELSPGRVNQIQHGR